MSIIKLIKQNIFIFISGWLFLLALWTIFIKFIFPILYSLTYEDNLTKLILWDFWWVAHIILAISFLNPSKFTYFFGVLISITEIIIVIIKLFFFFDNPNWNIWDTNWMINKVFVLLIFNIILFTLLLKREQLTGNERSK